MTQTAATGKHPGYEGGLAPETVRGIGRFLPEAGMDGDPAGSTAADSG